MNYAKTNACAICGEGRHDIGTFFLLAENRWEDQLTILQWNEQMALRDGIQAACSVNHVEEMVIHWMTTGGLAHPFARTALGSSGSQRIAEANAQVDSDRRGSD
jgi:hypothetical protein